MSKSDDKKKRAMDPDELLGLQEDLDLDLESIVPPTTKSFSTTTRWMNGLACPKCGQQRIVANNIGITCASCSSQIVLRVEDAAVEGFNKVVDEPVDSFDYIINNLLPEFKKLFTYKHTDYGDGAKLLGVKGQYADMNRKMTKLKRALWDDQQLSGEQPREILMDLIGHCFLTIDMIDVLRTNE